MPPRESRGLAPNRSPQRQVSPPLLQRLTPQTSACQGCACRPAESPAPGDAEQQRAAAAHRAAVAAARAPTRRAASASATDRRVQECPWRESRGAQGYRILVGSSHRRAQFPTRRSSKRHGKRARSGVRGGARASRRRRRATHASACGATSSRCEHPTRPTNAGPRSSRQTPRGVAPRARSTLPTVDRAAPHLASHRPKPGDGPTNRSVSHHWPGRNVWDKYIAVIHVKTGW